MWVIFLVTRMVTTSSVDRGPHLIPLILGVMQCNDNYDDNDCNVDDIIIK